jgi:hypothetical protein
MALTWVAGNPREICQDNVAAVRDSNPGSSKYASGVLTTRSRHSLQWLWYPLERTVLLQIKLRCPSLDRPTDETVSAPLFVCSNSSVRFQCRFGKLIEILTRREDTLFHSQVRCVK